MGDFCSSRDPSYRVIRPVKGASRKCNGPPTLLTPGAPAPDGGRRKAVPSGQGRGRKVQSDNQLHRRYSRWTGRRAGVVRYLPRGERLGGSRTVTLRTHAVAVGIAECDQSRAQKEQLQHSCVVFVVVVFAICFIILIKYPLLYKSPGRPTGTQIANKASLF